MILNFTAETQRAQRAIIFHLPSFLSAGLFGGSKANEMKSHLCALCASAVIKYYCEYVTVYMNRSTYDLVSIFFPVQGFFKLFKKFVALFPIRSKMFIKKATEIIEKFSPHRLPTF